MFNMTDQPPDACFLWNVDLEPSKNRIVQRAKSTMITPILDQATLTSVSLDLKSLPDLHESDFILI